MAQSSRLLRLLPAALVAVALAAVPSVASADASGPQIVSWLNAQRAAQGFPADITENASQSAGCARHNHYGALNHVLTHQEDPLKPGYTAEGSSAASQAVLYQGSAWSSGANPFETAPIHLHQLLSPYIASMGAAEGEGYGCATTLADLSHAPAATDTLYTYPADGTKSWRASEIDSEGPFTPGETVGIPQGTRTGPTLYVLASGAGVAWGSDTKVLAATLTGPGGATVPIVTFDRSSPQVGPYLPAGAQLLPRDPLSPGTTYTASIRLQVGVSGGATREFAKTWSFTTSGAVAVPIAPVSGGTTMTTTTTGSVPATTACSTALRFSGSAKTAGGVRQLKFRATACKATTLRVTLRRGARTVVTRSVRVAPGSRTVTVALPRSVKAGRYRVAVSMAGAALSFTRTVARPGR